MFAEDKLLGQFYHVCSELREKQITKKLFSVEVLSSAESCLREKFSTETESKR